MYTTGKNPLYFQNKHSSIPGNSLPTSVVFDKKNKIRKYQTKNEESDSNGVEINDNENENGIQIKENENGFENGIEIYDEENGIEIYDDDGIEIDDEIGINEQEKVEDGEEDDIIEINKKENRFQDLGIKLDWQG